MIVVLMSALLLGAADPAPQSGPLPISAAPVAQKTLQRPRATDMTCWEEQPTGSRISERICATREQLEKAERDAKDVLAVRVRLTAGKP